jgi:hypothetical protein
MSPRRIFVLVALLLVITVLIVAASRSQKTEPAAQRNPEVINHTRSLEVISAARNGGELYIAFRNDYTKNVMAYAISIGNERFTEDFAISGFAEAGILPNTTYELRIPVSDATKPINIAAVILYGGTGDGSAAVLQEMKDHRLAERIQIERTLKLFGDYLELPSSQINAGVGVLKSQLLSELDAPEADSLAAMKELQPSRQWNSLSEETRSALGDGKQDVLREFKTVEAAQNTRRAVLKLKEHYERVLRRF